MLAWPSRLCDSFSVWFAQVLWGRSGISYPALVDHRYAIQPATFAHLLETRDAKSRSHITRTCNQTLQCTTSAFHDHVTPDCATSELGRHSTGCDHLSRTSHAGATLHSVIEERVNQTEDINRFGRYAINFSRTPEPLPRDCRKPTASEDKGQGFFDYTASAG
jgi:hypothetical protein